MRKRIHVEIPAFEFITRGPQEYQSEVLTQLRDAGIPVEGFLFFRGVSAGKIIKSSDPFTGNVVFDWIGDEEPDHA